MIVVMEAYWRGLGHTTGNASTLRVVREANPTEPIAFLGERDHMAAVLADLPGMTNLTTHEIEVPDEESSPYARLRQDWRNVSRAFDLMRKGTRGILVLCSAYRASLALCAMRWRLAGRPQDRIVARLHGNLNEITSPRARNPVRQALRLESGLRHARRTGIRLVVLEQSIRQELLALRPELNGHVYVLEEPPTFQPEGALDVPQVGHAVRFAFLGVGTQDKGADRFLSAAADVRQVVGDKAEFRMIGRLHPSLAHLPTRALVAPPNTGAIPRRAYIEQVNQQHYVCAFYEPNYYRLGASGVLLDAIAHRKPVIVTDIPFARDLFARFGDIGDICRSQAEIVQAVTRAATVVDPDRYRRQIDNLDKVARSREIAVLAPRFRAIVDGNLEAGG